jgi:hypothetical protein
MILSGRLFRPVAIVSSLTSYRLAGQVYRYLCVYLLLGGIVYAEDQLVSDPVVIKAAGPGWASDGHKVAVAGEKALLEKKPGLFSIYMGNRFAMRDANTDATNFANTHVIRTGEAIYKGTASLNDPGFKPGAEPTLRMEWEKPFADIPFLPSWKNFAGTLSFEGAFSAPKEILASQGGIRYQNSQANHLALTDVTYTGALRVTEKRQSLMPMLGFGIDLQSAGMQRMRNLRVTARLGIGLALQNGQRSYELTLDPQYIQAAQYTDTYVIKSTITQSYALAVLAAGRFELGVRMHLTGKVHIGFMTSFTVLYGVLPIDAVGTFTEQAGVNRVVYQKVVSTSVNQEYLGLIPAVFLALSYEL